jgi:hypothetical protein
MAMCAMCPPLFDIDCATPKAKLPERLDLALFLVALLVDGVQDPGPSWV